MRQEHAQVSNTAVESYPQLSPASKRNTPGAGSAAAWITRSRKARFAMGCWAVTKARPACCHIHETCAEVLAPVGAVVFGVLASFSGVGQVSLRDPDAKGG